MPTNRRYRSRFRGRYAPWIGEALRTGRSDHSMHVALHSLETGTETPVVSRNRLDDHRLDVTVVRDIWDRHAERLLADHVERWSGTRPVPWWWWDSGLRIEPGSTIEEIEDRIGDQGTWLLDHDLLTDSEV